MYHVVVYALHGLALLRDHVGELPKDLAELRDGRLDRLDRRGPLLHVARLLLLKVVQEHLLLLLLCTRRGRVHHVEREEAVLGPGLLVLTPAGAGERGAVVQHVARRRARRGGRGGACKVVQWRLRALLLCSEWRRVLQDLLRAVFGRLHVLRAHLEDLLEARGGGSKVRLEHGNHVPAVLFRAVLPPAPRCRVCLELGELPVEPRNIVLDNVGELADLDGPVVKERLTPRHCS